jgi:hypothetical protein
MCCWCIPSVRPALSWRSCSPVVMAYTVLACMLPACVLPACVLPACCTQLSAMPTMPNGICCLCVHVHPQMKSEGLLLLLACLPACVSCPPPLPLPVSAPAGPTSYRPHCPSCTNNSAYEKSSLPDQHQQPDLCYSRGTIDGQQCRLVCWAGQPSTPC